MVTIHGLRYGSEIQEECDSLEEALDVAQSWLDADDEMFAGASYAMPIRVTDESGAELLKGDELLRRLT